jgi:hypothetical protein
MSKEAPRAFRRRLIHARPRNAKALVASLPQEEIEPHPYSASELKLQPSDVAVLLLDHSGFSQSFFLVSARPYLSLAAVSGFAAWVGSDPFWCPGSIFSSENAPDHHLARAVRSVFRFLEERTASARRRARERNRDVENLNRIGISLAAENDPHGRSRSSCAAPATSRTPTPAASPHRARRGRADRPLQGRPERFGEARFREDLPIDDRSIAGHVARTGAVLRIDDVLAIPGDPRTAQRGLTTRSATERSPCRRPMKNPRGGSWRAAVMNRKRHVLPDVTTTADPPGDGSLRRDNEEIARSLASQAAVALENARLTEHLKRLFEGFVAASVTAIEQRDPTTSGHSERVAVMTCALAQAADRTDGGPYAGFRISAGELTALRYAAVLHDFGKVGVREAVLKARKLPPGRIERLAERFDRARLAAAARLWERGPPGDLRQRGSPGDRRRSGELEAA